MQTVTSIAAAVRVRRTRLVTMATGLGLLAGQALATTDGGSLPFLAPVRVIMQDTTNQLIAMIGIMVIALGAAKVGIGQSSILAESGTLFRGVVVVSLAGGGIIAGLQFIGLTASVI